MSSIKFHSKWEAEVETEEVITSGTWYYQNEIPYSAQLIKQKWNYSALPMGIEYHTIQRGDFMYKIANRYGISVNELCEINGIRRNKVLIVGRKLRIK